MTVMFLSGKNVYLRALQSEDVGGSYPVWINAQAGDTFTEHATYPHSTESLAEYILSANESKSRILLGIFSHSDRRHVGNIELRNINHFHRTAEYLILVDPGLQGQGLASEASRLLLTHAFKRLNLERIELSVRADNDHARVLYERLGFRVEGVKRSAFCSGTDRYDVVVMSILRCELVES